MVLSPSASSIKHLESQGYTVSIVERRLRRMAKADAFGCIDIMAVRADVSGVLGVQVTSDDGGHIANRLAKARACPALRVWLAAGNRFEVHGWGWKGPKDGKEWKVRIESIESL